MSEDPVKNAYRLLFGGADELNESAKTVLDDLRRFCFVDAPTFMSGHRNPADTALEMALNEGRRGVWLRIMNYLKPEPPAPPAEQAEMQDE